MKWVEKFREVDREKIVEIAKKTLKKPEGKIALDYLKDKRLFSDKVIDQFNFGYCPKNIDHQLNGRIIIPVYDAYGGLVALSTRHIEEDHNIRFWHESYDKSFFLYALNFSKRNILKCDRVILVEGEFDTASLHSFGFNFTIGICGSAFSLMQIVSIARYCNNVYLLFDGDNAGRKAIDNAMKTYNQYGFNKRVDPAFNFIPVHLPNGLDPEDYVKSEGKDGLINLFKKAKQEYELWINN